nr:lipase family protein [Microvirga antarctica]
MPATAQAVPEGPVGDAFYAAPSPLPTGRPGAVIWTGRPTATVALPSAGTDLLVMYHSTALDGRDIAVTGTVSVPPGPPPEGGWPLITWTHGTTGLVAACAPSRDRPDGSEHYSLGPARARLDAYVRQGYAVVFSDFQGLGGSPGLHPFLQGEVEARGALDIMRAAREIAPSIGTRYVAMGHSQGGQADLFTAHFGPSYAPEFTLLGSVAFAPGSHLGERIKEMTQAGEPSVALVYAMYFLQSAASNHPEIDLRTILTPTALAHLPQMQSECVSATLTRGYWSTAIPKDQFLPGADLSMVLKLAADNDPGHLKIAAPTLIMQGAQDVTVLPRTTDAVARDLCKRGNALTYRVFPSADHESVVQQGGGEAAAWIRARLEGESATTNCQALPEAARP